MKSTQKPELGIYEKSFQSFFYINQMAELAEVVELLACDGVKVTLFWTSELSIL